MASWTTFHIGASVTSLVALRRAFTSRGSLTVKGSYSLTLSPLCTPAWWPPLSESPPRQGWTRRVTPTHMKEAVRAGRFADREDRGPQGPLTFAQFVPIYVEQYVKGNDLASVDTIEYRLPPLLEHFGSKPLSEIKQAGIESFIVSLKQPALLAKEQKTPRARKPATINRYLSLLRHMFNWAVEHEFLERSPMSQIRQLQEDNRRHRRLALGEEQRLLELAAPHVRLMIIFALDTGLRRGEMLAMHWDDLEARSGWIRVRGETAKSGRTRWVPIGTARLQAVLDFLRLDASGLPKPPDTTVFSNEVGEPIRYFETAWRAAMARAGIKELRWHDLRHEYASRLVERLVPLSQVRDLLGHASIVTTERYDNQKQEALFEAAKRLETGESFKIACPCARRRKRSETHQ